MKRVIGVAAVFAALGASAAGVVSTTLTSAPTASAAATSASVRTEPVMYSGMARAWDSPAVRPSSFVFGTLWGAKSMSWSRWSATGASGKGTMWACPGAAGPCLKFRVAVKLSGVAERHGKRYFTDMSVSGGARKPQRLALDADGVWMLTTSGYGAP
jgi:hypothetical protein